MKPLFLIYLLLVPLTSIYAQEKEEQEEKLVLSGYIKNLNEFSFIDNLDQLQWTTLLHNRLNFKYSPSEKLTVRLEFRNRLFYGDNLKNILGFSEFIGQDSGITDASWHIINNNNILLNTTIDRALFNYTNGDWDLTIGRQRVNWSMNLIWNPNDIFNTYNFLDFDYEERPGSDAIRVQYYLGDFSKIEVAAKKGYSSDDVIVAAMYKFNKASYDIQLLSGIYKKDWVFGIGWAGNLKNTGFKGEASYFVPYETYFNSENIWSASVSIDYGFKNGWYIHGSVLYNSSVETSGTIDGSWNVPLSAKKLMPYTYSGFLQLAKEFTPIFKGSFSTVYSPTRHAVIILPSLDYSVATNWELNFTGQSFFEFEEYQSLGHSLFVRLRWSF